SHRTFGDGAGEHSRALHTCGPEVFRAQRSDAGIASDVPQGSQRCDDRAQLSRLGGAEATRRSDHRSVPLKLGSAARDTTDLAAPPKAGLAPVLSYEQALASVRELAPKLKERAPATERARRI